MLRQTCTGWLAMTAWALGLGLGLTLSAGAAEPLEGKLIAAADTTAAVAETTASDAATNATATAMPEASSDGATVQSTTNGEKINVKFEEAEHDIMTKAALDKLDVVIESLEFSNADLRNVIRIIGERLNINFIFDAEDITGKVTLRLRNIRLKDALDSILTTRKLAIVPDRSGIFRIVPQERVGRKTVETKTEVIQLNWVNALDLKKTLTPFISEDVGKLEANEESNALIITDVPPQIETVKRLLKEIDLPERQVQIEARLADVNIGALRNLTSNWSVSRRNDDFQRGIIRPTAPPTPTDPFGGGELLNLPYTDSLGVVNQLLDGFSMKGGKGTLGFGETINIFGNEYNLQAVFTALESRDVVQILANPRVTTLNNVPANIKIIEKIPYREAVSGPSQGTTTQEIEFEEAGVMILAKPIITPNGYVRLEIKLEQRIFRNRVGTDALDPPAIDVRNADTNVIVPNMNTVVLGGLRQVRQIESIDGLPWLHRIPIIGWLFKDKNYDQSKIELVLMMTPTIIQDDIKLTDREKFWYNKIDTDWHLPDYFFDETKSITDDEHKANRHGRSIELPESPAGTM